MLTTTPLVNSQSDVKRGAIDFELIDYYANQIEFSRMYQKYDSIRRGYPE
jgi:hypothetical protein